VIRGFFVSVKGRSALLRQNKACWRLSSRLCPMINCEEDANLPQPQQPYAWLHAALHIIAACRRYLSVYSVFNSGGCLYRPTIALGLRTFWTRGSAKICGGAHFKVGGQGSKARTNGNYHFQVMHLIGDSSHDTPLLSLILRFDEARY
jgi:hypothetical protein